MDSHTFLRRSKLSRLGSYLYRNLVNPRLSSSLNSLYKSRIEQATSHANITQQFRSMVSSISPSESSVSDHYTIGDIMDRIKKGLADSGKDLGLLKVDDLAPCDAFHSRGRVATTELTDLIEDYLTSSTKVLDVGCGLGGTSRHLADKYGCRVTGIDLTEEYVQVGNELNKMVGIDDRVNLLRGNALDLPFNDKTFDLVWTEHVQMNIADKAKFYAEISRVLKPSGCFLFHDVFRGPNKDEPVYPAPWAEMAELSCLENVHTELGRAFGRNLSLRRTHSSFACGKSFSFTASSGNSLERKYFPARLKHSQDSASLNPWMPCRFWCHSSPLRILSKIICTILSQGVMNRSLCPVRDWSVHLPERLTALLH